MRIFSKEEIEKYISVPDLIEDIEKGFLRYSSGTVVVPPVGHMSLEAKRADLHIKYCHIPSEKFFVVKIASYFPENVVHGKSSVQGGVLLFSQSTGELVALFQDEGYMSHVRTAVAGACVAKYLAPKHVEAIGIIGSGTQARMQLEYLQYVLDCKKVYLWARKYENAMALAQDKALKNYQIEVVQSVEEIPACANFIVTTTSSKSALLQAKDIRPGTHITAMGSDSPGKQELDPEILKRASLVVADSLSQCLHCGELSHWVTENDHLPETVKELGAIFKNPELIPSSSNRITVADLTGVAVQDLVIACTIYERAS
jgi:ornithine cyclodeaminase